VRYSADTFDLYNGLFKEAHVALTKEGRVGRLRQYLGRLLNPETEKTIASLGERVGQQDIAVTEALERLTKKEWDEALALRKAEGLAKEVETYGARPGALGEAEQSAGSARLGRNVAMGAGGLGIGVGMPAAYAAGHGQGEAGKTRTRNIAFGAGAATGLAAPTLIRGLGHIARGAGQTGIFPELEGFGGGGY
jgi:hypothetical protein